MLPALEKLLPLLALLPHAAGTSMKIDYLRLANVRTDPITHPDGPSPHVHSFYGASEAAPSTTYEKTFRDAPKAEDVEDDELRSKLEQFQPAPFDATRILSEAVDGVTDLPGGLQPVIDPTASTATNVEEHCFADASNTFHVWVDPYASELGSWKFLECGDTPNPVLAVEKGVTYTFEQFDALVPARKPSAWARRESRTPSPRPRSVDNAGRTGTTPWRSARSPTTTRTIWPRTT